MDFPFKKHFGTNYQQVLEHGVENKFHIVSSIAVVKPLNNDRDFLVDLGDWEKLPWSGWRISKAGYISCCSVPLHQVVAWLNGVEFKRDTVIDHINRNRLDNRMQNLRPCTSIQNSWNTEKRHGHQLKNGKWRFTFSKSYPTMAEAEEGLRLGGFQYMSRNRTCFITETFDTYEDGYMWWKWQAGIHYGEFSPFANPFKTCSEILKEKEEEERLNQDAGNSTHQQPS